MRVQLPLIFFIILISSCKDQSSSNVTMTDENNSNISEVIEHPNTIEMFQSIELGDSGYIAFIGTNMDDDSSDDPPVNYCIIKVGKKSSASEEPVYIKHLDFPYVNTALQATHISQVVSYNAQEREVVFNIEDYILGPDKKYLHIDRKYTFTLPESN